MGWGRGQFKEVLAWSGPCSDNTGSKHMVHRVCLRLPALPVILGGEQTLQQTVPPHREMPVAGIQRQQLGGDLLACTH